MIINIIEFLNQLTSSTSYEQIDNNYRQLISLYNQSSKKDDSINVLIKRYSIHLRINYQSKNNNLSTIPMLLLSLGLYNLFHDLIGLNASRSFDPNICDDSLENCLFKLINSPIDEGRLDVFLALIRFNCDINHKNMQGHTVLSKALSSGNAKICELLLNNNENSDSIDTSIIIANSLENLLHLSIKGNNPQCLELLIKIVSIDDFNKMKIESNAEGDTPLQLVIKNNTVNMIKYLSDNVNTNFNNNKDTSLELLCRINNSNSNDIINQLKENYLNDWNEIYIQILESKYNNDHSDNAKVNYSILNHTISFFLNYEYINKKENQILPLNYIISSLKLFDYNKMISIYRNYLNSVAPETNYLSIYVFYVNASLVLIDMLLTINQTHIANLLIQKLSFFMTEYQFTPLSSISEKKDLQDKIPSAYMNSINLFTEETNWFEVIHLYSCYYNLTARNFDKATQNLKDFKKEYKASSHYKNAYPLYNSLKCMYNVMKVKLHYHNKKTIMKCYKHLNSLYCNYDNEQHNIYMRVFYYNSIGIINLKQGKYSYGEYYFKLCEKIIRKNEIVGYNYLNCVLYNIALCYFFEKKYGKSYKLLSRLKEIDFMIHNPYLFYRLGLCCIERDIQETKQNNNNNKEGNDEGYQYLFLPEGEFTTQKNNNKHRGVVLLNCLSKTMKTSLDINEYLIEAINAFKQCLLIIQGKTSINKEVSSLYVLFNSNYDESLFTDGNKAKSKLKQLYISAYENLLFCLLKNGDYTEVIYYGIECKTNNLHDKDKVNYIIDNYLIEAYLRTNNFIKALELLSENIVNDKYSDSIGAFINSNNQMIYTEVNYKLCLYINLLQVNIMKNDKEEIEKNIMVILAFTNNMKNKDYPPFVINILIYYYIFVGKQNEAYKLIKFRQLSANFCINNIKLNDD